MGRLIKHLTNILGINALHRYPYPAHDITLAGDRHLHLVGSIHMGTKNMFPLSEILIEQLNQSDTLIVEADITQSDSPFHDEFQSYHRIEQRLSSEMYQNFQDYCNEIQQQEEFLNLLPSWQIALILQAGQAQNLGLHPQYGIDYQLLNAAKAQGKTIIELEGTESQINLLNQIPNNGLPLLEDTLTHWHANARALQTMISWWMDYQPEQQEHALPTTFSKEIYQLLMTERNKRWNKRLQELPAGRYLVAVGVLHLYGEGNLPKMLTEEQH
ncbi:TraB/GumN family protein [Photorhabdus hindustanensis]|uniref:Polysaccharide biosynthesis protein GumN n=1 Tax=Photorhabdus hindustanensis TaxID=2918802 RepID=A0A2S8Q9S3_9GAMM|nr:TraB/GumN family protein [Photorhabdus hindustanensis]PQQ30010.1 polysaccharide biosynthesis protein GumN [Photorhabdus hindustanensis]